MIKKIITSAALIAAGTALASAETVLSASTASAGDTLGDLGLTETYDSASYDWCVSFTIDTSTKFEGTRVYVLDSSVADNSTDAGLEILVNAKGGYLNIANSNNVHLGTPDSGSGISDAVFDTDSDTLDLSLSWSATAQVLTLSTTTTTDGSTYSTELALYDGATHSEFLQYAILSTGSTFRVAATNITVEVSEVPEPSMFGLLAGLGAIGLVAARRRRNRKA
ncbi:MAG: PEP-CTERM sorting domain-containing protein [Opitutae bacterium]|nr:PEP-CTERM sorting domain-containing protein [Opitutae bacterium]